MFARIPMRPAAASHHLPENGLVVERARSSYVLKPEKTNPLMKSREVT
jgi:hypothetical protein